MIKVDYIPRSLFDPNQIFVTVQLLASTQAPQQLYVIYSNASITNISLTHPANKTLHPSQELTIPPSCDNPLQCGIITQQDSLSEIYIPNKENNSLIVVKFEGEMLYAYHVTIPCVFNDFALRPNVDDYPLLIACVLRENNDHIRYVLSKPYNETRNGTESILLQQPLLVNPIVLTLPNNDKETDDNSMRIISINIQSEVVVFRPGDSELETLPLTALNQSCMPKHIQKVRSDVIFLLTCEDGQSCLVNVSVEPINCTCFSLPANSTILALANNARYSLVKSSTNVTINEVSSQSPVYILNAMDIYGGDFGPDDKFAYVVTDKGIHFINVVMALEGAQAGDSTVYTVNISVCTECPPVVFLNCTTVLVSSVGSNNTSHIQTQLQFFDLSSWPLVNSISKMLNDLPRLYWYDNHCIRPNSVTPSHAPSVSTTVATITSATSGSLPVPSTTRTSPTKPPGTPGGDTSGGSAASDGENQLVGGIVGGLVIAVIVTIIVVVVYITKTVLHRFKWRHEQSVSG